MCIRDSDSSYQLSKIAEIFWVNQQGALDKQLDLGRYTGILATEVLLQQHLGGAARIFRESKISNENSNFSLFYQNIPFFELVSKKTF